MFRYRVGRLLSLAVASISFSSHLAIGLHPAVAQEQHLQQTDSCFSGVDLARLSFSDLSMLVAQTVADLHTNGQSGQELVKVLGQQLAANAKGCSSTQVYALLNNVDIILRDIGVQLPGRLAVSLLFAGFAQQPGAVADAEVVTHVGAVY